MKFRYKKYGPGVLRPVIPIRVQYQNRSVAYEVLIDSGADFSIFDSQVAELLDIPLTQGEPRAVAGITGMKETYYIHPVSINVGGWLYDDIKVGFLPNIARLGYGVVGQIGFFDIFIVRFDLIKEEIELRERRDIVHFPSPIFAKFV